MKEIPLNQKLFNEIETITEEHKTSRIVRIMYRIQYYRLRWQNRPMPFMWVEGEGELVGEPIEIYHLTLHDMMPHEAMGVMTGKVLIDGLRANAIEVLDFKRVGEMLGKTRIQPRWV